MLLYNICLFIGLFGLGGNPCSRETTSSIKPYTSATLLSWVCSSKYLRLKHVWCFRYFLFHHVQRIMCSYCYNLTLCSNSSAASTLTSSQKQGLSWSWSYGSWIYNYLCNQCLSVLMLWVLILHMARCIWCNFMW